MNGQLTSYMEPSPSWQANSCYSFTRISQHLTQPEVSLQKFTKAASGPYPRSKNTVHTTPYYFSKIWSILIFSSQWSIRFWFSHPHIPARSHDHPIHLSNYIRRRVQAMKFPIRYCASPMSITSSLWVQIFFSEPCPREPSAYVIPLLETKFLVNIELPQSVGQFDF